MCLNHGRVTKHECGDENHFAAAAGWCLFTLRNNNNNLAT